MEGRFGRGGGDDETPLWGIVYKEDGDEDTIGLCGDKIRGGGELSSFCSSCGYERDDGGVCLKGFFETCGFILCSEKFCVGSDFRVKTKRDEVGSLAAR